MTSPRAYNASGKALKKRPNNRVKIELQNLLNLLSSETLMKPWQKYTVGVPAAKGWNNDCSPFSTISHTSHVESALKILDDDKIKAGLVFDDSILNKKRILVSWLSPNTWGTGYRYGNIKFEFDFKRLIKNKRFYWVEVINYKIPALRILVTGQDYSEDTTLTPYDPEIDEGPWWFDKKNKQHYFHGTYCLEFMFECNIELKNALSIEFVRHHSNYCSVHRDAPHNCTSRGSSGDAEGAMLLGRLAAEGSILSNETSRLVRENGKPTNALEFAFDSYSRKVGSKATFSGQVKHQSALAESLARSICALFSVRNFSDAQALAGLFASEKDFENAIAEQIGSAAELHNWALLVG